MISDAPCYRFFVKTLQTLIHQNSIKHADPRNTKASGCQKGQPVDSYLPGILIRQDVLIDKIYQADSHHCPQKKV